MNLEPGDLIFWSYHDPPSKKDGLEFAVSQSYQTDGEKNKGGCFHAALIANVDENHEVVQIVHAVPEGTKLEPLKEFHRRLSADVKTALVITKAKLNVDRKYKIDAVHFAMSKSGQAYNDIFAADHLNSESRHSYYCCQLIIDAYKEAKAPIDFPTRKMNFRDQNSRLIPFWVDYFAKRSRSIPENEMGSHPAMFLNDEKLVTIVEEEVRSIA
uniref:Uncharacterized protein n=1 Tax=Romanomermis culicivorax TaxID=13658 RepID=A0A915JH65_ROMCU